MASAEPNINILREGRFICGFDLSEIRVHHVLPGPRPHVFSTFPQLVCDLWPKYVLCAVAPGFDLVHRIPASPISVIAVLGPSHGSELADSVASRLVVWVWRVYFHRLAQLELSDGVVEALSEVFVGDSAINIVPARTAVRFVHALFVHIRHCVGTILPGRIDHRHDRLLADRGSVVSSFV